MTHPGATASSPPSFEARRLRVLHLFSGKERKADVRQHLEALVPVRLQDVKLVMLEIDLARDKSHDLRDAKRCAEFVIQVLQGH